MKSKCRIVSDHGDVCQLPPNHQGVHIDGAYSWPNESPPKPDPIKPHPNPLRMRFYGA
jgi:hypothetical protein